MRNTQTEFSSSERTPAVLPEMEQLLPPLCGEQRSALEKDILENGCYSPIIVNEDMVVIDGHNRLRICQKYGLPYKMLVFAFEDLLEAKRWALDTQKGRRNLTAWELGQIALKLKPDIAARARANQSAAGGDKSSKPLSVNSSKAIDTRKELAQTVGIGEQTMGRIIQIDEHAPEVVKEALDKGELSINQGYNITKDIQKLPEGQREDAAMDAVTFAKYKKAVREMDAEIDRQTKIANQFCKAYEKSVLLTPSAENVRFWVENCRMTLDEMEDTVEESFELAGIYTAIGKIIRDEIMPKDWRNKDQLREVEFSGSQVS